MYSKEDIGEKVYLPYCDDAPLIINQYNPEYSDEAPFLVSDSGGVWNWFDEEGYLDGIREGRIPILSRTPWTQRAVTEKPWEPEVGELVILPQALVGQVIKIDPTKGDMKFEVIANGISIYWEVSQLLPFSKESAEQAIYPTHIDRIAAARYVYDQSGTMYEVTSKDGVLCAFHCGHYLQIDTMGRCFKKGLAFTLEPPKQ